jgi:hypothetical protein
LPPARRKKHLKLSGALFSFLFAFGFMAAQAPPSQPPIPASPVRDSAAVLALDGAFDAMAGPTVRQSLKSVVVTGTISWPGNPATQAGTFTVKFVGSHFLLTTSIGGHQSRFSALGRKGQTSLDGNTRTLTVSGASDVGADIFPLLEPWSAYADASIGIVNAPDQTIEGTPCKEIDILRPLGFTLPTHPTDEVRIFLDQTTGMIRGVDYAMNQTRAYDPSSRMRILYDDYQIVNGLRIPTTITRTMNGRPMTVLHVASVDASTTFDDSALIF